MRLASRQAIGILLSSIFLSSCADAPTRPRTIEAPPSSSVAEIAPSIEFVDAQGRVNKIERVQVSSRVTQAVWTIDGKPAGQLVGHLATDGSVERITGRFEIGGHKQEIDQRYKNGKPLGASQLSIDQGPIDGGGGGATDWGLECTYATLAVAAAAGILALAILTGNLVAILAATLGYFSALAAQADYCRRA